MTLNEKVALVFRRLLVSEEKRKVPFLASADVLYCAITKCHDIVAMYHKRTSSLGTPRWTFLPISVPLLLNSSSTLGESFLLFFFYGFPSPFYGRNQNVVLILINPPF